MAGERPHHSRFDTVPRGSTYRSHRAGPLAAKILASWALICLPASAARADVAAVAGADYSRGPAHEVTKSVLGVVSVGVLGGFATVAGIRFDDSLVGPGIGAAVACGAPIGSPARSIRVVATRYLGDGAYRGWRFKTGPFLQWSGTTLGLSFVRYTDNDGAEASGGVAEIETPIAARWSATLSGSAAEIQGGASSVSGSAGVRWAASPHLTLTAEAGVARNGSIGASEPAATKRGILTRPIPGLGSGSNAEPTGGTGSVAPDVAVTARFGLRIPIP